MSEEDSAGMSGEKAELLRKLSALAERGEPGERENARAILAGLMEKYGVEEADLRDDALEESSFVYCSSSERRLLIQTTFHVTKGDRRVYSYKHGKGSRSAVCCMCSKAEAVQIGIEYDFYRELWKKELDLFFRAFINKHKIFSDRPTGDDPGVSDQDYLRMAAMMAGLQDKSMHPMLEGEIGV